MRPPRKHPSARALLAFFSVLAAATAGAVPAVTQPFWGYNASQGACPEHAWTAAGDDCADARLMGQRQFSVFSGRPAVYRMRAQHNICEAYAAVGRDCFTFFDRTISWAAQHNQKVLLIVTQSDSFGADYDSYQFPQTAEQLARYREWWRKLTVRYGNDSRVIGAEVWNEPNGTTQYTGGTVVGPSEYAKAACAALAGRNDGMNASGTPRLKLYLGALAWNTSGVTLAGERTYRRHGAPSTHMGVYLGRVVRSMTEASGCASNENTPNPADRASFDPARPDGISFHVYNNPQINWGRLLGVNTPARWLTSGTARNPCDRHRRASYHRVNGCNLALSMMFGAANVITQTRFSGGGSGEVLISELGYLTSPVGSQQQGASPQSQRWAYRYITSRANYSYLQQLGVRGIYAYPVLSNGGDDGRDIEQTGLWRADFTPNPAAEVWTSALQDQINHPSRYP